MHFTKYNGLGNDFIFLDGKDALAVTDLAALARRLCDRYTGIGADGLVLLLPSAIADIHMRIINSDGSEAEMCGNASRCVALHLSQTRIPAQKQFTLETLAGLITTEIIDIQKQLVRVNMGTAKEVEPLTVQVAGKEFAGMCVSMGNPHFVIPVEHVETFPIAQWGPLLETHPAFPHKTNVEFVEVLSQQTVRMRVWERGAGITRACGTGSCATAVACATWGLTEKQITVQLDGGELQIAWPDKKEILMTGPAQKVFEGDIVL